MGGQHEWTLVREALGVLETTRQGRGVLTLRGPSVFPAGLLSERGESPLPSPLISGVQMASSRVKESPQKRAGQVLCHLMVLFLLKQMSQQ